LPRSIALCAQPKANLTGARPACPVAPADGTGVGPEDRTGVKIFSISNLVQIGKSVPSVQICLHLSKQREDPAIGALYLPVEVPGGNIKF